MELETRQSISIKICILGSAITSIKHYPRFWVRNFLYVKWSYYRAMSRSSQRISWKRAVTCFKPMNFWHMLEQTEVKTLVSSNWLLRNTIKWWQNLTISPTVFSFNSKSKCFKFLPLQSPNGQPQLQSKLWEIKDIENQPAYYYDINKNFLVLNQIIPPPKSIINTFKGQRKPDVVRGTLHLSYSRGVYRLVNPEIMVWYSTEALTSHSF